LDSFIKDPETDVNIKCINKNQDETIEEEEFEQSQHQPSLSDSDKPTVAIDWDSDQNWQRRFFKSIIELVTK